VSWAHNDTCYTDHTRTKHRQGQHFDRHIIDWLRNNTYQGISILRSKVHLHPIVRADDSTGPQPSVKTNHTHETVQISVQPQELKGGRGDDIMILRRSRGVQTW
jgi:hypothetical protein